MAVEPRAGVLAGEVEPRAGVRGRIWQISPFGGIASKRIGRLFWTK